MWQPLFRYGTITAISDEGLASVTLDSDMKSSAQGLDINQENTLSGVAFEYMDCDDGAFTEGDEVLIMFENQQFENPKIIGFKEEPKECCEFVELFSEGSFDWPYWKQGDSPYAVITSRPDEPDPKMQYYLKINVTGGSMFRLIDYEGFGGSVILPRDTLFWNHTDLNVSYDITDASGFSSTSGIHIGFTSEDSPGYFYIVIGRSSVPSGYYGDDDDYMFAGLSEDKLDISEQLAGYFGDDKIILVEFWFDRGISAKLNYFKLCANAGAEPMPEYEA
jgi:hypothetical protein